jgi:hypothetical protein
MPLFTPLSNPKESLSQIKKNHSHFHQQNLYHIPFFLNKIYKQQPLPSMSKYIPYSKPIA